MWDWNRKLTEREGAWPAELPVQAGSSKKFSLMSSSTRRKDWNAQNNFTLVRVWNAVCHVNGLRVFENSVLLKIFRCKTETLVVTWGWGKLRNEEFYNWRHFRFSRKWRCPLSFCGRDAVFSCRWLSPFRLNFSNQLLDCMASQPERPESST